MNLGTSAFVDGYFLEENKTKTHSAALSIHSFLVVFFFQSAEIAKPRSQVKIGFFF